MATRSFADIERIVERYDAATTELDQAVTGRIADSLDASYRNLERELRRLYPTWQSDGSLFAVQRRLLLMEQLGEVLAIVRPEMQGEYERLMAEALQISHESGAKMADELIRARDPGYPLQEFTTVPIEAAVAQARDGVQRLYRYNDEFKTAVSGVVEQGLLQGWGAEKVARMLRGNEQMQGQFGLAQLKSKAETIARTEIMASFDTATQQRYAENGITHIQWLVSPSEGLCSFCLARHGNVYKLGEVSAPNHPRCRCITASWLPKWQERGWTDDAAIAADKTQRLEEMAKLGTKPNYGPTHWEKRAGLEQAPQPVWKPGDKVQAAAPVAASAAAPVQAGPRRATAYKIPDIDTISNMPTLGEGAVGKVVLDESANVAIKYNKDGRPLNEKELRLSALAGELGIGPKVIAVSGDKKSAAIELLRDYQTFDGAAKSMSGLSRDDQIQIAKNVVNQLANLHSNRILHNDFHTGNVMFNPTTRDVRIIDYGLANDVFNDAPGSFANFQPLRDLSRLDYWFRTTPGLDGPAVRKVLREMLGSKDAPTHQQILDAIEEDR